MARRKKDLYPHEQLMLLALRDEQGTVESKAGMYTHALGGAILSELVIAGCLRIDPGKKKLVDPVEVKPMHDPVLDDCLALVFAAKRRRRASSWVGRFAGLRRLRHRIALELCKKGVLKDSEAQVLLFFRRKVYPTIDSGPERELVERLRRGIFADDSKLDDETSIVVALAHATGLLRIHFDRRTLKQRKQRLEQIARGELVADATREAVQAVQAAVIVATAAAATAGTASH